MSEGGVRGAGPVWLRATLLSLGVLLAALTSTPAAGQGFTERLRDPQDGALDASAFLASAYGFLPVVSLVTEPAVGYGAGGALAFLHRPEGWDIDEARERFSRGERLQPASLTAAYGMYTTSESWAVGAAHLGLWRSGSIRYLGNLTGLGFNLSIAGSGPLGNERLFEYSLDGWATDHHLRFRVSDSDWYVGLLYDYLSMSTSFQSDRVPGVGDADLETSLGSLGAGVRFDSRSNSFTPDYGAYLDVVARRQDPAFGSDFSYWTTSAQAQLFLPLGDDVVVGIRGEGGTAETEAPFWARPSVTLRGVARNRYAGEQSAVLETEVRWDLNPRWSLVGFGGYGITRSDRVVNGDDFEVGGGGGGVRYLIARAFGIRGGFDLANGRDGWAFYTTIGTAWGGF